jgi:hypothetical protein
VTKTEIVELIDAMRLKGARRVRVGDVEVEWSAAPAAPREPAERRRPEEVARLAREHEDALLFAASG